MSTRSLTRAEVRRAAAYLKSIGRKLPKHGYCMRSSGAGPGSPGRGELCRDKNGYYWIGAKPPGFDGLKHRKRPGKRSRR
jgi:hypothetical protein